MRESQRRRRAGGPKGQPIRQPHRAPLPELEALRFETARDVLALLTEQVNAVRGSRAEPLTKARTVGYLGALLLRAIEAGAIEIRLEALERAIEGLRDQRDGEEEEMRPGAALAIRGGF